MEFLRPHATKSCNRDRMTLRLTCSSNAAGSGPCSVLSCGLVTDQCIPYSRRRIYCVFEPVQCAHPRKIQECGQENDGEDCSLAKAGPTEFSSRNRPTKQKDSLQIEDHEKHCDQVEPGRPAEPCRALGFNSCLIRHTGGPFSVPLSKYIRNHQHPGDQQQDEYEI